MSKEITKPERVMYYESSKMRFLEYVDQLEAYAEKLEKAINYTRCSTQLADEEKEQLIYDSYWLNLQNLSGREDFEQTFMLGIKTGVDETLEKLQ